MSDNKTEQPINLEEHPYIGNHIPKLLRWVYVIFIVWAIAYGVINLVPDLMQWLNK